ncbi:RipA family octameric membrane protein [Sphaerothrix gracilis]|uniref:RipA family octameric membrane protein n=1 Tax=Sphaerothrix gracilis TaxID=3151835 RepID=UPI0031FCA652
MKIREEDYGSLLIEQYKIYIEMMDRVTSRRGQANAFYISVLSGILVILSFPVNENLLIESSNVLFVCISLLGLVLCLMWYVNLQSYKQLNRLKFQVIYELEQDLPFPMYQREWDILVNEKNSSGYYRLTAIEKYIPLVLAVPYLILLILSITSLYK